MTPFMVMCSGKEKGGEERYSREIGNSIGVMGYVPKNSVGEFEEYDTIRRLWCGCFSPALWNW